MIHIFDVDDTILKGTSMGYFLRDVMKEGLIRFSQVRRLPFDWIKYKLGFPDLDFIENTAAKLEGIKESDVKCISEKCFESRIKKVIYTGAVKLINELKKNGERVIFATSSVEILIRPIERFFGIEGSIATKVEFRDGLSTGRVIGKSFFGEKKKLAVQEWLVKNNIQPCDISFYSDSYIDIPLLEYCGNPVAVNPDWILTGKAKKRGWKIIRFKELLGT